MDNAQKAIMIGVGLFITIIVIAAVMLITGMGQDLLNSGTKQVQDITSNINQNVMDSIAAYNGRTLGGVQTRSIVRTALNAGMTVKNGGSDVTDATSLDASLSYTFSVSGTTITLT